MILRLFRWLFGRRDAEVSMLMRTAVMVALENVGRGEHGGNNKGTDVDRFRDAVGWRSDGPWCASFASYCYVTAAARCKIRLPFKPSHGARRLYKRMPKKIDKPLPGALALYKRGDNNTLGHVGIVWIVLDETKYVTIEGNRGSYPSTVRTFRRSIDDGDLIGFAAC